MIGIATLVAVITAPCEFVAPPADVHVATTVSMSPDRSVTIHVADPRNATYPDEILKPGMMNYDVTIKLVGGISPGQTKSMPSIVGSVSMNSDSSIEIRGSDVADLKIIRPNDASYEHVSSLVGPLRPGEWVALKAPASGACAAR
jgi:hypothetical protein